jgi:hypothetical protein
MREKERDRKERKIFERGDINIGIHASKIFLK